MQKLLLSQIVNAASILGELANQKLPSGESWKLAKLNTLLATELEIYDKERIKLCERYGEKDEEKNRYEIKDQDNFNKAFSELSTQEVELGFKKIKLPNTIEITANELMLIEKFIEFEEE